MICKACGEDCRVVTIDNGIGFGEYWGAPFYDIQLADVTACCEAGWYDDELPDEPGENITEADMEWSRA
jgi:hypothetical protein